MLSILLKVVDLLKREEELSKFVDVSFRFVNNYWRVGASRNLLSSGKWKRISWNLISSSASEVIDIDLSSGTVISPSSNPRNFSILYRSTSIYGVALINGDSIFLIVWSRVYSWKNLCVFKELKSNLEAGSLAKRPNITYLASVLHGKLKSTLFRKIFL